MTLWDHIERELLLLKLHIPEQVGGKVLEIISQQGARFLDDDLANYTLELTGAGSHLDEFIERVAADAEVLTAVRSGPLAVGRGQRILGVTK